MSIELEQAAVKFFQEKRLGYGCVIESNTIDLYTNLLEFGELCVLAEREACAKIAEESDELVQNHAVGWEQEVTGQAIAKAIRARTT